jgi:hypothetical protein
MYWPRGAAVGVEDQPPRRPPLLDGHARRVLVEECLEGTHGNDDPATEAHAGGWPCRTSSYA